MLLVEPDYSPLNGSLFLPVGPPAYYLHRKDKTGGPNFRLSADVLRNDGRWRFVFRVHEKPVYNGRLAATGNAPLFVDEVIAALHIPDAFANGLVL